LPARCWAARSQLFMVWGINDLISRECNYDEPPFYVAERPGEIKRMCIDNSRAVKILKWNPRVHVREGITKAIVYYKNELIKVAV
jgi:dTDP-D-glucose 4,6-dehydratase